MLSRFQPQAATNSPRLSRHFRLFRKPLPPDEIWTRVRLSLVNFPLRKPRVPDQFSEGYLILEFGHLVELGAEIARHSQRQLNLARGTQY
jgi:hypothetical protein